MLPWKGYLIGLTNELLNKLTDCGWKWLVPHGSVTKRPMGKLEGSERWLIDGDVRVSKLSLAALDGS